MRYAALRCDSPAKVCAAGKQSRASLQAVAMLGVGVGVADSAIATCQLNYLHGNTAR